jgi:uncharacterized membrane protein
MQTPRAFTSAEALRFGWHTTMANLKSLLVLGAVAAFLALLQRAIAPPGGGHVLLSLLVQLAQVFVTFVWIRTALLLHDGEPLAWPLMFQGVDGFLAFLLTAFLFGLIVAGGMILLVVPGVYWALKYGFALFVAVDQKTDPVAALRESGRLTDGEKWHLLGFGLLLMGVNLVGAMALGVGLLVTLPTTWLAAAYVYRKLEVRAGSTAHYHYGRPTPAV